MGKLPLQKTVKSSAGLVMEIIAPLHASGLSQINDSTSLILSSKPEHAFVSTHSILHCSPVAHVTVNVAPAQQPG